MVLTSAQEQLYLTYHLCLVRPVNKNNYLVLESCWYNDYIIWYESSD